MHLIRTHAQIGAEADDIWAVLADFDAYAEWNPLNIRAKGQAVLGLKVPMTFLHLPSTEKTIDQTVTVTTCEPGRALAWSGSVPLLFKGRHHFSLTSNDEGTLLEHGEDLRGIISATISKAVVAEHFVPAYGAVNVALAKRLGVSCR
jgi:hypothetical protein